MAGQSTLFMRHFSTQAVIIRKRDFREHDQFVTMFSPELGKFEALARGARKINSSFMGNLEVMNFCVVQIYAGNQRYTLTECRAQETFRPLREDLDLSMQAMTMLEIYEHAVHSPEKGEELFTLLLETFRLLEQKKNRDTWAETFKIKLLTLTGSMPDISTCTSCQVKWQKEDKILLRGGNNLLCNLCAHTQLQNDPHSGAKRSCVPLSPAPTYTPDIIIPWNIMKLIHYLATTNSAKDPEVRMTAQQTETLKNLTRAFLREYVGYELKSEGVTRQMETPLARLTS